MAEKPPKLGKTCRLGLGWGFGFGLGLGLMLVLGSAVRSLAAYTYTTAELGRKRLAECDGGNERPMAEMK